MLEARGLSKSYGLIRAVDDVDVVLRAGEVHALVGENGAGKSTVAKIIAGTVTPDAGEVRIDGTPLPSGDLRAAHRHGVYCAFQELALVPHWTVAENLVLVDGSGGARFSRRRARTAARGLLERLGLGHLDDDAVLGDLPLADRQQVEIARAIAGDVRVLLLDEASSALTSPGVAWLFDRIRELTARGVAVGYVSHRLGELAEIADRGTVLRDGRVVGGFERGAWTDDELITMMAGRPAGIAFPPPPERGDGTVLRVEGLQSAGLRDVSFSLRRGEILGVGGLQGHGQAELLRALFGAVPATADQWEVDGMRSSASPRSAP
jgi:ribose transport system ATP-binding protein